MALRRLRNSFGLNCRYVNEGICHQGFEIHSRNEMVFKYRLVLVSEISAIAIFLQFRELPPDSSH